MKKTTRTWAAFDENQLAVIAELRKAFAGDDKKEISNKELFMIGLGVGFNSRNKLTNFKRSNTGVRIEYFERDSDALTMLASLQVAVTNDANSLLQIEELYDLAEQYAGGGIAILANALETERDFNEWFQSLVFTNLVKNTKND